MVEADNPVGVRGGTRPRTHKVEALVLRSTPVLEADRVVTLLSPGMGKLKARVRGARKITSRLGGHLDTLNRVSLSLAEGRTFFVATGAEALETFAKLKSNLDQVAVSLYFCELADMLIPEGQPHPAVYRLLVESLRRIDQNGPDEVVARYVEMQLLKEAGYMPELGRCVTCGEQSPVTPYGYAPGLAGLACGNCVGSRNDLLPLSIDALKVLRFLAPASLAGACRLRLDRPLEQELEVVLGASLRYVIERELGTSSFVEHLRRLRTTGVRPAPPAAATQ